MTLDIILFRKKNQNYYILLPFSLFVCFLPSLTNKWPLTTLSMFEEGPIDFHEKKMSRYSDIKRYLMAFMTLKAIVFQK